MTTISKANPFDLLGQSARWPRPVHLRGDALPKLEIAWNSFHSNFLSGIPVFFQRTELCHDPNAPEAFPDTSIERPIPRGPLLTAVFLHIAILLLPWPYLPSSPTHYKAFENTQLTWSGPIDDLPLLDIPRKKNKSTPKESPSPPPDEQSTAAFHPRQRIATDPIRPTHPRQTLVNPTAPPDAPKFLPDMPNVVQIAASNAPARPRMEINSDALAKLHPKSTKALATSATSAPELPNFEQHVGDINLATSTTGPVKPKLPINASSAPRLGEKNQSGDAAAPDVPISGTSGNAPATLIALSASPAPPAPVVPAPQGNLAARVAVSPEGKPGASGSSSGTSTGNGSGNSNAGSPAGNNSVGVSISGGAPKPNASTSGLGAPLRLSIPKASLKRSDPNATDDDPPIRTGPPNFGILPPGAKPEQIFGSKRIYTMNVNMPNVNSATGSWIIHFSELHLAGVPSGSGAVSSPVPVHKADPKYPQTLMQENIQGEVVLYAVIRRDGNVDSIQKVRGVDEQLDANAIAAFAQWRFEPAMKGDTPVDLEAIVYIPFKAPPHE